jgi:hypothetical protein
MVKDAVNDKNDDDDTKVYRRLLREAMGNRHFHEFIFGAPLNNLLRQDGEDEEFKSDFRVAVLLATGDGEAKLLEELKGELAELEKSSRRKKASAEEEKKIEHYKELIAAIGSMSIDSDKVMVKAKRTEQLAQRLEARLVLVEHTIRAVTQLHKLRIAHRQLSPRSLFIVNSIVTHDLFDSSVQYADDDWQKQAQDALPTLDQAKMLEQNFAACKLPAGKKSITGSLNEKEMRVVLGRMQHARFIPDPKKTIPVSAIHHIQCESLLRCFYSHFGLLLFDHCVFVSRIPTGARRRTR